MEIKPKTLTEGRRFEMKDYEQVTNEKGTDLGEIEKQEVEHRNTTGNGTDE